MGIVSILLILLGLLMLIRPSVIWLVTESWKSSDTTHPSDFYVKSTRLGGVLVTLVGIRGVWAFWFL